MRILLIGAGGQLGADLQKALSHEVVIPLTHSEIEVTDSTSIRRAFEQNSPEVVINTAAFHRVDDCETDADRAFRVNALAVHALAIACKEFGAALVHFSTDYVFGGEKTEPYVETDCPHPLSVYGASKLAGEQLLAATLEQHFLVRTCGLYGMGGSRSKGGNFVETMLRLASQGKPIRVVDDQVVTPTYTADLAHKVSQLIQTEAYGLHHITNNGSCSWFEFAQAIFEVAGIEANLQPISSADFAAPARRPAYSVLHNARLEAMGLGEMPAWRKSLARYLAFRSQ
jgi:dTDP-4-dehydrorhamnose reductase